MWAHTFSPYLCCYRSLFLYVCVIVSVDRFTASLSVERVFIGAPPAYVCVVCFSPFLYPGSGADQWWRAVQAGVINDDEVIAFDASVPERRCAVTGGEDTNGVSLGTCFSCYRLHPGVGKRRGQVCGSLLHQPLALRASVPVVWRDGAGGQAWARLGRALGWRPRGVGKGSSSRLNRCGVVVLSGVVSDAKLPLSLVNTRVSLWIGPLLSCCPLRLRH